MCQECIEIEKKIQEENEEREKEDMLSDAEIKQYADFAWEIQGNVEDSLILLEDELNPVDLERAEEYLIDKYGEPE